MLQKPSLPVHRLPAELLTRIFSQSSALEGHVLISANVDLPLWILGRVCSRWRQIALNSPTLWTDIRLSFVMTWKRDFQISQIHLFGHQLERSGNLPLKMQILCQTRLAEKRWTEKLLNLFATNSHRIKELIINDFWMLIPAMGKEPLCNLWSFPLLHVLNIEVTPRSIAHDMTPPYHIFQSAKDLMRASFNTYVPSSTDLNWMRLKVLSLRSVNTDSIIEILPSLTALISLTVAYDEFDAPSEPTLDTEPVTLPSLERLTVPNHMLICCMISAPKLQEFVIGDGLDSDSGGLAVDFIYRSCCSITSLKIKRCDGKFPTTVVKLLGVVPDIRRLEFTSYNDSDSHFLEKIAETLASQDDSGAFKCCPHLEDLLLDTSSYDPKWAIDMVQLRWDSKDRGVEDAENTLRRVIFRLERSIKMTASNDFNEAIRRLKEEGMDIVIDDVGTIRVGDPWY